MGGACSSASTDESGKQKQKGGGNQGKQASKGGTSQTQVDVEIEDETGRPNGVTRTSNFDQIDDSDNEEYENSRDSRKKRSRVQQRRSTRKNQTTPREPVNEKGYKAIPIEKEKGYLKRIRENLRQAATNSDIEELENAIHNFEKNKLEDNGDLTDAKERLHFLYLRKELRDAILRRHPGILDKAIYNVENSMYRSELNQPLESAKKLREHLTELDCYRHDILRMDQSTISELRSYHHPPDGVHEVMMGTYLLLGYDEDRLRDWTDVQCLLARCGKESLIREIQNSDTVTLDDLVCRHVTKLQSKTSPEKIREVSNGAATFYVWNENMVNKATKDRQAHNQPSQATTPKGKQKQKGKAEKPRPKNQG